MILVTGATGLVGSHLLYHLSQENSAILAMYRSENKLKKVQEVFSFYTSDVAQYFSKIKWIKADITDVSSLETIFSSDEISHVYHCAALVSFDSKDYHKMRQTNIDGTANIVNISIAKKVKKLCFVSSIAAVGDSVKKQPITEENEWSSESEKSGYAITKHGAEMEVWRASQEGIDVVIVNPGIILGSGFFNEGSSKLFSQIKNGFKFYTEGVTGFVGVKDVVKVMINLMQSNIINERFILVSENKSFKDVFYKIADELKVKRPSIRVNKALTSIFWRLDWVLTKVTRKKPLLTRNSARSSHNKECYSSEKIKKTLNFKFETIDEVITETCKNYATY